MNISDIATRKIYFTISAFVVKQNNHTLISTRIRLFNY